MSDTPRAVILMGSGVDLDHCTKIADAVRSYGIEAEMRVGSAHKTPAHVSRLLEESEARGGMRVYITVAGLSNALSGFTEGSVSAPVIACPPPSQSFAGADIYSSIRMPAGIAVATILDPHNAALFVAKLFALSHPGIAARVEAVREAARTRVLDDDRELLARSQADVSSPRVETGTP